MEPLLLLQGLKQIHSPLYDRRLMILILKKSNGRRSFSENCRLSKIALERRNGPGDTQKKTLPPNSYKETKETSEKEE